MGKNLGKSFIKLYHYPPKRFFAFGCSFTKYFWPTWADILAYELNVPYWNYAVPGVGNQYICNMVAQADNTHDFTPDDLIIICWSSAIREDRFLKDRWLHSHGNVYSNEVYDRTFTEKYCDPVGFVVRDLATIKLTKGLLDSKHLQYHFSKISEITQDFHNLNYKDQNEDPVIEKLNLDYRSTIENILPSFTKVLWDDNLMIKKRNNKINISPFFEDRHPTPVEHLSYLKSVFDYQFSKTTEKKVVHYHSQFRIANIMQGKKFRKNFSPHEIKDREYWNLINDSPFPKSNKLNVI